MNAFWTKTNSVKKTVRWICANEKIEILVKHFSFVQLKYIEHLKWGSVGFEFIRSKSDTVFVNKSLEIQHFDMETKQYS